MIDLQLLSIAVGVIIAIVTAISLFLIYGNRERSFDEVYGQSRGLNILLDETSGVKQTSKGQTSSLHKEKKKKAGNLAKETKKEKKQEQQDQTAAKEPELPSEKEPTPVIVEPVIMAENTIEEPTMISGQTSAPSRKKRAQKKEKFSEEKVTEEEISIVKNAEPTTTPEEITVTEKTETVIIQEMVSLQNQAPPEKPKKKKQKAQLNNDLQKSAMDVTDSDSPLNAALKRLNLKPLSEEQQEIVANFYTEQQMLAKNEEAQTAVPVVMDGPTEQAFLKKIDEKERALNQEKQKVATTLQTISNLNQELISERQRNSGLERSFKEQLTLIQSENQQLNQQLRDFQAQMQTKMQTYHQMENQLRQLQSHSAQIQQLREENQREMQRLKQEILNRDLHIEKQRAEFEQLRNLQEAGVAQQILESKNALIMKEQENAKLEEDLKSMRVECSNKEQESKSLKQKYEEEVEQLKKMQAAEIWAKQEIDRSNKQIEELKLAFQNECSRLEKLRQESERDLTEKLRQKDQILTQNEAAIGQLEEHNKELQIKAQQKPAAAENPETTKKLESELLMKNEEVSALKREILELKEKITEFESREPKGVILEPTAMTNGQKVNGLHQEDFFDDHKEQEENFVDFEWDPAIEGRMPQKSVQVAGSFNNWTERLNLNPTSGNTFKNRLKLPDGTYEFKFIVDEHAWLCSRKYPMIGVHGSENNTTTVCRKK